ncbi:MAG: redoxin domain-containing protein [Pseudomonadota bacterium]
MVLAFLLSLALAAADLGPEVGSTIPDAAPLSDALGDEGATIVFVRSVSWCPYCKTQVTELDDQAAAFEAEGRPLVFVSYDAPALQESFAESHSIESTFVADEGSAIIQAFGLLNEQHRPGSRAYGIPHPAVFVVDENGVIEAKLYEDDYATNSKSYRNRPAVETILAAVKEAD